MRDCLRMASLLSRVCLILPTFFVFVDVTCLLACNSLSISIKSLHHWACQFRDDLIIGRGFSLALLDSKRNFVNVNVIVVVVNVEIE